MNWGVPLQVKSIHLSTKSIQTLRMTVGLQLEERIAMSISPQLELMQRLQHLSQEETLL